MGLYRQILNESYVINDKDIYINFDKWKREKGKNILFITGLSGSGKTTLGEKIEKEKNAKLFEIDGIEHDYDSSGKGILNKLKGENEEYKKVVESDRHIKELGLTESEYICMLSRILHKAINIMEDDYKTLYIVEGIQIFEMMSYAYLRSKPVIIKGTSMVQSIINRWKRNGGGKIDWLLELRTNFPSLVKWYMGETEQLHNFTKGIKEDFSNLNESKSTDDNLYFLSKDNMDNKTLYPRIPENYFTKNGYEDNKTKRVCFAPSVNKALMGISMRMKDMELYVHVPKTMNIKTYKPSSKEVPDSKITGETWVTHPIGLKCIGKIKVIDDAGKDGHKFTYGDKTAELYDWDWEWIEKYDKESVNENVLISDKDFSNNLEKWTDGDYPVLLITGLSGGGKSTLANQLANKYKADVVELDQLVYGHNNSKNNFIKKFMENDQKYKQYNHISEYWKDKNGDTDKDKLINSIKEYIHFCVSYALKNNIKIIIEGIQIYQLMYTKEDLIYMTDKPIIIKGTSPLISRLRQFKRIIDGGNGGQTLKTLIQDNKYLKEFRDDIKSTINENYNYSDKFSDVLNVVRSLSDDEKYYLAPSNFTSPNGSFVDSPYRIYRKVYKNGKNNMGFIELYSFEDKSKAYIAIAVSPKYRGKGLSKLMVNEAINSLSNKRELKKIIWGTVKKNEISNKLAEELNFKLFDSDEVDNEYEYILKKNQNEFIKEVNEMGMFLNNIQEKIIYDTMKNGDVSVGDDLSRFVEESSNYNHYNNRRLYNDNEFGIPKLRKYPLINKNDVLQAMKLFNKCEDKYKKKLAVNIVKRARELNMGINLASDYYKIAKNEIEELPINENDCVIEEAYLLESNSSLYKKRYQCPYCNDRYDRQKLVSHIEKKHEDFIPENYTATRVVFNLVNKKEKGSCVICGKETPWDENKEKYDRICSESCVKVYVQQRNDNMLRVRGKLYVTDDPEFQKKMLANRKISGEYIWSDGVKRTYTGSYEKKLLEFLDKVMGFKSVDVITPGDTVVYDYNGKNHTWILDCTIVPYNLQIDAKDGGDNPNNREMTEYRDKQIAKEKAILQQGQYNYLRLTNNNFSQLLTTLAQIKMNLLENNSDKIWNVNEYMAMGSCNPIVSGSSSDANFQQKPIQYIVPAMVQNSFVEPLYARDKYLEKLYRIVDGKLTLVNRNDIKKEFDISDKLLKSSEAIDMKYDIDDIITNEEYVDHNILYEMLTGHKLLDKNQYLFDENLSVELEGFYEAELRKNILENTYSNIFNDSIIISENINKLPVPYKNIVLERDCNGFFARNINNKRTKSYSESGDIPMDLLDVLNNM